MHPAIFGALGDGWLHGTTHGPWEVSSAGGRDGRFVKSIPSATNASCSYGVYPETSCWTANSVNKVRLWDIIDLTFTSIASGNCCPLKVRRSLEVWGAGYLEVCAAGIVNGMGPVKSPDGGAGLYRGGL